MRDKKTKRSHPNRVRPHVVSVRMNDAEYKQFLRRVAESGLTQQSYLLAAALDNEITSSDAVCELKAVNTALDGRDRQLRGIGTNANQMAHVANSTGELPVESELSAIHQEVSECRSEIGKEMKTIWQYLRRLNIRHNLMAD